MKLLQRSLVARIVASLLAISAMALISIVVTMAVAGGSRGDAAAINVAGSLRMNTYQIVAALQRYERIPSLEHQAEVHVLKRRFEERLASDELTGAIPVSEAHELRRQYRLILGRWHNELAPQVSEAVASQYVRIDPLNRTLDGLVGDIDTMVKQLEQNTEAKIRLLSFYLEFSFLTQFKQCPVLLRQYAQMPPESFAAACWGESIVPVSPRFGQAEQKSWHADLSSSTAR